MPRATGRQPPADSAASPPSARPLLPAGIRPAAVVLVAACGAIVALLGALFYHQTLPDRLDRIIDKHLYASLGAHRAVLDFLIPLGIGLPVTVAAAVMILACLGTRRWRGAVLVAVAVPAAGALTDFLLKPLVGRTILGWLSFPSGHATGAFSIAAAFAVLLINPARPQLPVALRRLLAIFVYLVAVSVAIAVTAKRMHYFTDTVGGAAVGIGTVLATALIVDRLSLWLRRRQHIPDAPADSSVSWAGVSPGPKERQADSVG
jgi:membrane-associated phospholipid phosphatase